MPPMTIDDLSFERLEKCATLLKQKSPPSPDTVVSMLRSLTLDDDYFHRRALHKLCTQRSPGLEDFLPQASEIVPNLFIADLYTATSPAVLTRLGVTHVVSVVAQPGQRYPRPLKHLCVPIEDQPDAELLDYLDGAVEWIAAALAGGGRVLVHCVWGMSRSASVVIAFLMAARGMSLREAHALARSKRRVVRPNSGFLNQLSIFERVTRLREGHTHRQKETRKREQADVVHALDADDLARRMEAVQEKGYFDARDLSRKMAAVAISQEAS